MITAHNNCYFSAIFLSMRKQLLLGFILIILSSFAVSGQYYETGQDPSSLKWKQIKTGSFTVIFPEKYEKEGFKYARSLEESAGQLKSLFPGIKLKIPVVIHNYTVTSNGYVAWAPGRMELYPTPEQNNIPLSPVKQLTVHETAHVLQLESLNTGFTKGASFLLGEQITGAVSSLLPMWFLEGDAVFAETALTPSGRGRTASFQKPVKALLTSGIRQYSYDKIINGSFRDFTPDPYATGYQMVATALLHGDKGLWNKVLKFTGSEPFTINPVNISLTRNAGLRKKKLWIQTADTLRNVWNRQLTADNTISYQQLNTDRNGSFSNYYSPVSAGSDSIIAIKTSLVNPSEIVLITQHGQNEKYLLTPGLIYPWFISYAARHLVWVETHSDPRWANREYSVIMKYDLKSGTADKLSSRSRYLAASLSPDGRMIAAVENSITNENSLVFLDADNGNITSSVRTPSNIYLQHPMWQAGGEKLSFIYLNDAGEGIVSYNRKTGEWMLYKEASRTDLQSAFLRNDSLFYVSSVTGTENIFVMSPDGSESQLTRSKYGATDISPAANGILFSDYTALGNNVCVVSAASVMAVRAENSKSQFLINRFEGKFGQDTTLRVNGTGLESVPYRKWQHLFRFHSWLPFYADLSTVTSDPLAVRPGVTLMTQNTLGSLTSTLGYEYSAAHYNIFHSKITWQGWYPVIESELSYGSAAHISKMGQSVSNPSVVSPGISFTNTISVPLSFTGSAFSQYFRPSVEIEYVNNYIYLKENGLYDYGQTILTGRLYFSNYFRSALRDIYPRWAQVVDINYCFAPFDKAIYGSSLSLKAELFTPGIFRNNSLKLRFETEKQDPEKYLYGNFATLPRGFHDIISKKINIVTADYQFPLGYPDLNISGLLYIKRFRAGLFYDTAWGPGNGMYEFSSNGLVPATDSEADKFFTSYGFSLVSDFHLFRIPFMMSGGVQSVWKSSSQTPVLEMIFNIDLFGWSVGKKRL